MAGNLAARLAASEWTGAVCGFWRYPKPHCTSSTHIERWTMVIGGHSADRRPWADSADMLSISSGDHQESWFRTVREWCRCCSIGPMARPVSHGWANDTKPGSGRLMKLWDAQLQVADSASKICNSYWLFGLSYGSLRPLLHLRLVWLKSISKFSNCECILWQHNASIMWVKRKSSISPVSSFSVSCGQSWLSEFDY